MSEYVCHELVLKKDNSRENCLTSVYGKLYHTIYYKGGFNPAVDTYIDRKPRNQHKETPQKYEFLCSLNLRN